MIELRQARMASIALTLQYIDMQDMSEVFFFQFSFSSCQKPLLFAAVHAQQHILLEAGRHAF